MMRLLNNIFRGRAAVRELGAGGIGSGSAHPGLTAPAGVDACSCDWRFFPDALDVDCPLHGLQALVAA